MVGMVAITVKEHDEYCLLKEQASKGHDLDICKINSDLVIKHQQYIRELCKLNNELKEQIEEKDKIISRLLEGEK